MKNKVTKYLIMKISFISLIKKKITGEVPPYGTLCVRVYFRNNCLFVEVIRARNVIPLDNNGLSDPFVVVELLPRRVFQCPEQQTHVQKTTLNPIFDECFEL